MKHYISIKRSIATKYEHEIIFKRIHPTARMAFRREFEQPLQNLERDLPLLYPRPFEIHTKDRLISVYFECELWRVWYSVWRDTLLIISITLQVLYHLILCSLSMCIALLIYYLLLSVFQSFFFLSIKIVSLALSLHFSRAVYVCGTV